MKNKLFYLKIFFGIFFLLALVNPLSQRALGQFASEAHFIEIKSQKFNLELAKSRAEWMKGLMFRRKLAPRAGMLFISDHEEPRAFWMKNTLIPLDMVFISKDRRVINIVANAKPLTLEARRSKKPAMYVLEINGGVAKEIGLNPGDQIRFLFDQKKKK